MTLRPSARRRLVAATALAIAVPLAMSSQGSSAAGTQKGVVHGANGKRVSARSVPSARMSRLGHGAGEPTIGFTRSGKLFYTASSGCVTSCAGSEESLQTVAPGGRAVLMTADKGKTWQNVSPGVGDVSPHVISMDPYLLVDQTPDGNRIFDVDLTVACAELSYSDDEGKSWVTNPMACGEPVNDHQTVFTGKPVKSPTIGYPKIVYYCFNHPAFTKCSKSLDGGLNFIPTAQISNPSCSGLNGHGVTDAKGTVYIPLGSCGLPKMAISTDEGDTWKVIQIADSTAEGDPSVAVDKNGTLYYLWVDSEDRLPHLSTSRNGGKSWSKPIVVSPRGIRATNLATLDVGAPGKVAIAYYGTTGDPDDTADLTWNGYIAEGVNVLTSNPTFYTAPINDARQPLKVKACRGRCGRVLDFIDVEIAPDGTPWGAYVDACLAACEKSHTESIHDNEGVVGTLIGAPSLLK